MFVGDHEERTLPLLNPGGVACFESHSASGSLTCRPSGAYEERGGLDRVLQTCHPSGVKILQHGITGLRYGLFREVCGTTKDRV